MLSSRVSAVGSIRTLGGRRRRPLYQACAFGALIRSNLKATSSTVAEGPMTTRNVERDRSSIRTGYRCVSTDSATKTGKSCDPTVGESADQNQRRKRRRHKFGNAGTDAIPSFKEFQQKQQVRGLYRQYLRLIWPLSQRDEMLVQVRHEFRTIPPSTLPIDTWEIKRSISEGQRRLKELSAMLSTSIQQKKKNMQQQTEDNQGDDSSSSSSSSGTFLWPWQMTTTSDSKKKPPPSKFPPKSSP